MIQSILGAAFIVTTTAFCVTLGFCPIFLLFSIFVLFSVYYIHLLNQFFGHLSLCLLFWGYLRPSFFVDILSFCFQCYNLTYIHVFFIFMFSFKSSVFLAFVVAAFFPNPWFLFVLFFLSQPQTLVYYAWPFESISEVLPSLSILIQYTLHSPVDTSYFCLCCTYNLLYIFFFYICLPTTPLSIYSRFFLYATLCTYANASAQVLDHSAWLGLPSLTLRM